MIERLNKCIDRVKDFIDRNSKPTRVGFLVSSMVCAGLGLIYGAVFAIAAYLLILEMTGAD